MAARSIADRYDLLDRLGQGGGGVVWRAHDRSLDRVVAIKEIVLDQRLPDDERERTRARALREARAAARLEHRHAVSVYDVRSDDDAIHIVMEFVDAPSLQQLVDRDGPVPPARVAAIGVEVLDALAAAHEAGIVHRDVKPSNVMISPDGALVTDFGIASVTGDTTALTMSGEALGTPDYISPEQVRGDEAGPATDLWSLGATLYVAVEGAPPFRRDRPVSTVHAVVHDDPRPMSRAGALAPVLHAMLAKDPGDRPTLPEARARLVAVAGGASPDDATVGITRVQDDRTQVMPAVGAAASASSADATTEMAAARAPAPTTEAVSPAEPPTGARAPEESAEEPRRRSLVGLAVLAVAALIGVAIVTTMLGGDDGAPEVAAPSPTSAATETGEPDPAATTTAPAETEGEPVPSPTPTPTDTPTPDETTADPAAGGELPPGWRTYEGPTYQVGHPASWTTRDAEAPNNIDLVAPNDADGYLRVAHTDDPAEDVLQDTERIETAFRDEHPDYQRIRLEPTEYRDTDAVIWEYTFSAGEQTFHAIHLNMSTGEYGYALNHVVPEDGWAEAAGRFEQFTESFSYPSS